MNNVLNTVIRLRRDTEANYNQIGNFFIPYNGEVCLVDTDNGLRAKVGDGVNAFAQLNYVNYNKDIVYVGYYLNGIFYSDSTYTIELPKIQNAIYIDRNSNGFYAWDGEEFNRDVQEATSTIAGVVKLYSNLGDNTDGTMTQKSIKESFGEVSFSIKEDDQECLILNIPQ